MKIGDKVIIKRKVDFEYQWFDEMDQFIGKEVTIVAMESDVFLIEESGHIFPIECLEEDVSEWIKKQNEKAISEFIEQEKDQHYKKEVEPIDLIEAFNLNFNLGNVIKYVSRCEHKENKKEDLRKALWYLEREINK